MKRLTLCLLLVAGMAGAAPESSKRPVGRPGSATDSFSATDLSGISASTAVPEVDDEGAVRPTASLRPEARPKSISRIAKQREKLRAMGAICGNPDLMGDEVGRVASQVNGCGIGEAVRVRSVSGVQLSPAALMNCSTALTLNAWMRQSAIPRLKNSGGGLKAIRVIGHYSCRTRNNRPGGRISEHGKGKAIDISEFRLQDGSSITVLKDWNSKKGFEPLREMHRDACGIFGTVLGPKSDRFHQDHFHFDTARHGNGPYCR